MQTGSGGLAERLEPFVREPRWLLQAAALRGISVEGWALAAGLCTSRRGSEGPGAWGVF